MHKKLPKIPKRLTKVNLKHHPRLYTTSSPSINPSEISHFSRLSSQWWNEQGEFGLLHKMNPPRIQFIRDKYLEMLRDEQDEAEVDKRVQSGRPFEGLDFLDVGCGGGLLSESLSRLGARTIGIDASESNIAIASVHCSYDPSFTTGRNVLEYRHCSAESLLKEKREEFDVVCCMEVLEHVDEPAEFLRTCGGLVKPGGQLILSTVSRTPLSYFLTIFAAEHLLRLVEPGTHTYRKFIKPRELIEFFCKEGWIKGMPTRKEGEIRGIVYLPWLAEWRLMRGLTECNYIMSMRKPKMIT